MKPIKIAGLGLILVLLSVSMAHADGRPEAIVGIEGGLSHVISSAMWFVKNMVIFGIGAVIYLAPTIIALVRSHNKLAQIVALNVFLGWIIVGWIGGLIWSLTGNVHSQNILDRFGSTA